MALCSSNQCVGWWLSLFSVGIVATLGLFWWETSSNDSVPSVLGGSPPRFHHGGTSRDRAEVLHLLEEKGVYSETDYVNELEIEVPYWGLNSTRAERRIPKATTTAEWGPCFAPHFRVDWDKQIQKYQEPRQAEYPKKIVPHVASPDKEDLADYCRPGFIIIGAGKCGTSSLYHYLTEHPRVLPASQKQIHYFKYYADRTMNWYLHHFPTATSFLSSGALMTGEASPGYLPYPDVAHMVKSRMGKGPRIITVGREPVDRAYSSYRYNYVHPTVEDLQKGKRRGIKRGQSDEYYEQFLFSFEDMMRAELQTLRECLSAPNDGAAVRGARETWGSQSWAQAEYQRREEQGLPPMADSDGFCYGEKVSETVLRKQWTELVAKHPEKVIMKKNLHLQQSFIGRSLYALPLEWWYTVFDSSDIYFICTEEMRDMSGEPLNQLGQFLGLSSFNFSDAVGKGAYNVGGHRGYDKEIPWTAIEEEKESNSTTSLAKSNEIPLSDEFRRELEDFLRPYNERLFELVGRRCDW